jgi:hypothetical protein
VVDETEAIDNAAESGERSGADIRQEHLDERNAQEISLLVGCTLTVLDEAPSDEERQQSLESCIGLLRAGSLKPSLRQS